MAKRYIGIFKGLRDHVVCIDQCWWHVVAPLVVGVRGSRFKGFNNLNDAIGFATFGCDVGHNNCDLVCLDFEVEFIESE